MSTIGRAEEQQNLSVSCAFEYEQMIEELFSGFHQGQRPAMPRKQAGHMTAPASTVHSVNLLLQTGGRPHMDTDRCSRAAGNIPSISGRRALCGMPAAPVRAICAAA